MYIAKDKYVHLVLLDEEDPLPAASLAKFVSLSTDGVLNHYEPTFKNITKDLERLNTQQEVYGFPEKTPVSKLKNKPDLLIDYREGKII